MFDSIFFTAETSSGLKPWTGTISTTKFAFPSEEGKEGKKKRKKLIKVLCQPDIEFQH
jgi:hypothetical protein